MGLQNVEWSPDGRRQVSAPSSPSWEALSKRCCCCCCRRLHIETAPVSRIQYLHQSDTWRGQFRWLRANLPKKVALKKSRGYKSSLQYLYLCCSWLARKHDDEIFWRYDV